MALLDDVKIALRISAANNSFNTEINDLISAAQRDLQVSGIKVTDTSDALIKRAIVTYCKAYFGYDNPDVDRLIKAYQMLKLHLMLSTEYNTEAVTDEA
jgi:nicotinamide riboside kinase